MKYVMYHKRSGKTKVVYNVEEMEELKEEGYKLDTNLNRTETWNLVYHPLLDPLEYAPKKESIDWTSNI